MPASRSAVLRLFPALEHAGFRWFWLGMLPAPFAWQMYLVAAGYIAFTLSGAATTLGLVSVSVGGPMLIFALVGGVVADRLPRVTVILTTQTILGLTSAVLAILSVSGQLQVWHLIAAGLVQGTCFAFNVPARQALVGQIVPPHLLRSAVTLNNLGMNLSRIAGPALAGLMLSLPSVGASGVFISMIAMYGLILLVLFRLPRDDCAGMARPDQAGGASGWAQLVEGLRYIRSSPVLRVLLALVFVPLFFGMPYQTLMPLFAERVFSVGAAGLGTAMAAIGLGALAGSVAVAALSSAPRPERFQVWLGVGFGVALVGFGLAPSFPVALAALVVVGFTSAAYGSLNNSLVMNVTEPRFHGRVMSVYMMSFAITPVASVPAAWLADHVGGRPVVIGGGLAVIIAVLGLSALAPRPTARESQPAS